MKKKQLSNENPIKVDKLIKEGADIEPVDDEALDLSIDEKIVTLPEIDLPKRYKKTKRNGKAKKDIRYKLKYRTKYNDINYKAPISYRHLRILGWLFLAISQVGLAFSIAQKFDTSGTFNFELASNVINTFSSLPFAFFILANFGIILRNRNNFRYLFIFYGGIMAGLYVAANLVTLHYVYGTFNAMMPGIPFQEVAEFTGTGLFSMGHNGYIFNLFVDLFLCVLTVFFTFYYPKSKYFQGKKIIIFRLFVLFPIAYETASIVIKQLCLSGTVLIPSYFFFLLTSKPPLTFGAFFLITLILKIREYKFLKLYRFDYQLLEDHFSTNAHSFRTSITIAVVFLIAGNIDILVLGIYITFQLLKFMNEGTLDDYSLLTALQMGKHLGFGESTPLILISPLILLYSYTKVHKNKKLDSFLPIIGIGLVVFTLLESLYLSLRINVISAIGKAIGGEGDIPDEEGGGEDFTLSFMAMKNSIYHIFHQVR